MKFNRIISFSKRYYIFLSIVLIILFVGTIAGYKIFLDKATYMYVKMKVNQGFWWATTEKPPVWYANAIQIGDVSYDFLNKPVAEIIDKSMYLSPTSDIYDIYVTVKIKVKKQTNAYVYNRSVVSVGSPLEIQMPNEDITGTIIAIDDKNFSHSYIEKTIYLQKPNTTPWEYDAISTGDFATDGKQKIFTIIDKNIIQTTNGVDNIPVLSIKAKVKLKKFGDTYTLAEEKIVKPGKPLSLSLSSIVLKDFVISKIE